MYHEIDSGDSDRFEFTHERPAKPAKMWHLSLALAVFIGFTAYAAIAERWGFAVFVGLATAWVALNLWVCLRNRSVLKAGEAG